jgi:NTP pyrophosphatase (non-canonical NTP hydrolase)
LRADPTVDRADDHGPNPHAAPIAPMNDAPLADLRTLQAALAQFARDREWERFHSPKNLAMALAGEAGELLEVFQWLTEDESRAVARDPATARAVRDEIADVLLYLARLADVLGIDLDEAVRDKLRRNAERYPVDLSRGHARKAPGLEPADPAGSVSGPAADPSTR